MAEKTKKLEAKLFQVRTQLERTSNANVEFESNDVKNVLASENIDKGKSILEARPKLDKK